MSIRYDAIVVGGGPAGSTAAHLLAAAGWRVVVVEHAKFPRRKVCGEFISGSTWPLLERLGIADSLLASAGPPVTHVGLFARDRRLSAPLGPAERDRLPGRAVSRAELDTRMLAVAAARGAEIRQPWTLVGHRRNASNDYTCSIESRETGKADVIEGGIIVAAHGAWEPIALPTAPSTRALRGSDLLGFKARFAGSAMASGLMPLLAFPGGYGGMVHSGHDVVSLSCCIRRDMLAACRKRYADRAAGDSVLAHIAASCDGVADALAGAKLIDRWIAAGPLATGIRSFGCDGVFAVGNAAAEAHPVIAEGISMAIQSSALLAGLLIDACALRARVRTPTLDSAEPQARGRTPSGETLDRVRRQYATSWRDNFATRLHAAALFANLFMRPLPTSIALRILDLAPALLTEGARWSGKSSTLRMPRELDVPLAAHS